MRRIVRVRGIFFKVFAYTTIFLIILVCVTVALFSQQFLSFYNTTQNQQLYTAYQDLYEQLHGLSNDEVLAVAQKYYEKNQSFSFYIKNGADKVIFSTPNIDPDDVPDNSSFKIIMTIGREYILCASNQKAEKTDYSALVSKSLLALAFMLAIGIAGAFIFARQMTRPIKRLAGDSKKMANLEDVP
ncbi:MAG: hypothetical protein LBH28_00530, partial [Oscillospiraceae bacterium]|nr:hypothetical protein [Oscillospiraceae bacterium]